MSASLAIAIVLGTFHWEKAEIMLGAARKAVEIRGLTVREVVRVPGAYEKPLAVKRLMLRPEIKGVLVLGIIERGETAHGRVMGETVGNALVLLQLEFMKPIGFGIIGPGIIEATLKNEPLTVMGDGEQSSDLVFIDDVVEAYMKAPNDAAIGKILEIGTGINTSVKQFAEAIIKINRSKSKIEHRPLRTGGVKNHTKSDTSGAKKYLGWEWMTTLEDGLRETISWYAHQLGIDLPREFSA